MILLKSAPEIQTMREAGRILARTLRAMNEAIVPGKTTPLDLDGIAYRLITEAGARPSFLGYRNFPNSVCISVNEAVVHGIPNEVPLQEGDIVGLDLGVHLKGFHADSAWTYPVGTIAPEAQRLLNVTHESLNQGIAKVKPGARIGEISAAVQKYVESNGYGIVRELVGHGIGKSLHEEPSVPNFGRPKDGPVMRAGMTFCIEPMVNEGTGRVRELADKWTIVTADGKRSAHFEHTIVVTKDGADILTVE
ncbi:MAG: type I methionyl aminopeptidase [Chthonomonas sp.]|nr:type I methionyl aminopeptidase [Chthonomonas sp.]